MSLMGINTVAGSADVQVGTASAADDRTPGSAGLQPERGVLILPTRQSKQSSI